MGITIVDFSSNRCLGFLFIVALVASFSFATSGFLFSLLNHMPTSGYSLSESGVLTVSYIDLNTFTSQFFCEAWIIGPASSLLVFSILSLAVLLTTDSESNCWLWTLRILSLLGIVWLYLISLFFAEKHHSYRPGFDAPYDLTPQPYD
jgi:hypothetical protein